MLCLPKQTNKIFIVKGSRTKLLELIKELCTILAVLYQKYLKPKAQCHGAKIQIRIKHTHLWHLETHIGGFFDYKKPFPSEKTSVQFMRLLFFIISALSLTSVFIRRNPHKISNSMISYTLVFGHNVLFWSATDLGGVFWKVVWSTNFKVWCTNNSYSFDLRPQQFYFYTAKAHSFIEDVLESLTINKF